MPKIENTINNKQIFDQGNYQNYYGIRNKAAPTRAYHLADPRLQCMDPVWFRGKRVLDIGCNSGVVTIEIAKRFSPCRIQGIDLDAGLIKKAQHELSLRASCCAPERRGPHRSSTLVPDLTGNMQYFHVNSDSGQVEWSEDVMMDDGTRQEGIDDHYFPISMPLLFNHIPIVHCDEKVETSGFFSANDHLFPQNICFTHHNFMSENFTKFVPGSLDVILALSVTKWIHLNHGDDGIREFFRRVFLLLSPDGRFIVEPQGPEGYAKFLKSRQSKEQLKIHPWPTNSIDEISFRSVLIEIGFTERVVLRDGDPDSKDGFKRRPVWSFTKKNIVKT